jgi:malonyl-CoA/methylmalonyl-CoA synthetase
MTSSGELGSVHPRGLWQVRRARGYRHHVALIDELGAYTYADLLEASARVAAGLLEGREDLGEARVAFLAPPGFEHVVVQWGIWRAGGIAVPLSPLHPRPELEYAAADAGAEVLAADLSLAETLRPVAESLGRRFVTTGTLLASQAEAPLPEVAPDRRAMILYTSGTTSRPKGVVTTHANIEAQVRSLVEAWEWGVQDRILHVLPLHHIHGIINVLTCALWAGAICEFIPRFDAQAVWRRFTVPGLSLFMAVPTIYERLIAAWESAAPEVREEWSSGAAGLRLMVSGSAALPATTLDRWREITGHTLLERYGMTEIGMGLSNPLHGPRFSGHVGLPLPGVEVRLVDETGAAVPPGAPGEIEIRGPGVFQEYWQRPEETAKAFRGGWFRTGDMAVLEEGGYRILGRTSVDIIKTGGYKVSALEIEETLRDHPSVRECAVVGLPDPKWGERVAAVLSLREGAALDLPALRAWCRDRLAPYKIPSRLFIVDALPRNAMGKVVKPELARLFENA